MPFPNNTPTPDDLPDISVQDIAQLPVELLAVLQHEIDARLKRDKAAKARLDGALTARYADRAAEERRVAGKDTGTTRFDDGDFTVVADLPKRVDWDQAQLAAMVERIRAAGDDPAYPLDALMTVCKRRCELILNFMHEHIQRHLYHPSEDRERWLRAIVGDGIAAELAGRELPAEDIREAVLRMFKTELRFVYACHSPIEMVEKRRLHFSMIYGTSAADGVFVLREVEKRALPDHEWKVKDRRARNARKLVMP